MPSTSASTGGQSSSSGLPSSDSPGGDRSGAQPGQAGAQSDGQQSGQQNAGTGSAGSQSGQPGSPGYDPRSGGAAGSGSGQQGGTSGDLAGAQGGRQGTGSGGDYTLDTLPGGGLGDSGSGAGGQQTTGTMTASERAAVLDGQLRRGYEVFDGIILDERQRTQREVDQQPSGQPGSGDIAAAGGIGSSSGLPQTLPTGSGGQQTGVPVGSFPSSSSSAPPAETFPPPEDIPSGRDDDVVARQLREAAMREPDPELREALWDEYRKYTGLSE